MADERRTPHRFRRRLGAAFVLVAALSSATLALVTYGATSSYRWRNFQEMTNSEVRLALVLAPRELDRSGFERLLTAYEKRSGTDVVAIGTDDAFYSSSRTIEPGELPDEVLVNDGGDLVTTETTRSTGRSLVVAGDGADGSRYIFFFSLEQLESSLAELRVVLVVAWVGVVLVAAAVGELVARRTLRPVREASEASTALAAGLLDTRLPSVGDDEFGAWATSFNGMADALAAKIAELRLAAERERQFTADVAHDLRTPLTGMAVRASLLLDEVDDLSPTTRDGVRALADDIDRLKDLVLDLLELARLDAGDGTEPPEALTVATGVHATVQTLHLPTETQVVADIDPRLAVCAARAPFRRILANLLANAATHGRGTITVSARQVGDMVLIDVQDQGPGIDEADRERIFNRFAKTDESRAAGGSGLGLAIAREHARSQGGDVRAGNSDAGGACFTVALPAVDRPDEHDAGPDEHGVATTEVSPSPASADGGSSRTRAAPGGAR